MSASNAGDPGLILGWDDPQEKEMATHFLLEILEWVLQYSCLENPMDGGAWLATVHGVAKSQTRLSDFTFPYVTAINA